MTHRLEDLAAEHWELLEGSRESLVFLLSPHIPPALHEKLILGVLKQRPDSVNAKEYKLFIEAVAASRYLSSSITSKIMKNATKRTIRILAENLCLPQDTASEILNDPQYAFVRNEVIAHTKLSDHDINQIIDMNSTTLAESLLTNPYAPKETLQVVLSKFFPHLKTTVSQRVFAENETQPNFQSTAGVVTGNLNVIRGLASNPELARDYCEYIIQTGDHQALLLLARNSGVSEQVISHLIHPFQYDEIKAVAAANPNISDTSFYSLFADSSVNVRLSAALNINKTMSPGVINELLFDEISEDVKVALMCRPEAKNETIDKYSTTIKSSSELKKLIKKAPELSSLFFHYALALEPSLAGYLVQRAECPEEIAETLFSSPVLAEREAALSWLSIRKNNAEATGTLVPADE